MKQSRHIVHIAASAAFMLSGLGFGLLNDRRAEAVMSPPSSASLSMFSDVGGTWQNAIDLPQLYISPQNLLMWLLLFALWAVVALDAVGQMLDPADPDPDSSPVWAPLVATLVLGAIWPWLYRDLPLLSALVAIGALAAALFAATQARRRQRPAISFLAGWTTGVVTAAMAGLVGSMFGLSIGEAAIMAILPGAALGIAVQAQIGPSIGFPAAMIWGFCGLAVTTMGTNPIIALAAIAGISAMAIVLIHAAS
ncbi:hypothetical protein [Paracoccus homiensis]|uniref:hypothetical protein n=1 Tax=Paracoccus homiensis TaxID=364199 RepID=UPI00398CFDC6